MSKLSTSLTFAFGDGGESGSELSVENFQQIYVGLGSLALAVIDTLPAGPRTLYTTAGTVVDINRTEQKTIDASFLQVDGIRTVKIHANATYSILFAFDVNGTPITVVETARVRNEVTFSEVFYGLIKVNSYTVPVSILKYTPGRVTATSVVSTAFSITDTYGIVAVYKQGTLATCEVQPPTVSDGSDELEIYRVESEVVLNKEGEWEMPSGWPDNPTYPNGATPPRPRIGVVSTRVHEIGMVTSEGYFYSRAFDVAVQKPYFGDSSYKPTTSVVQGSGFSKLTPAMQVAAQEAMARRGKGSYI